jgi:hypothetical protein
MQLVTDSKVRIELLDIDWQKFGRKMAADVNSIKPMKPVISMIIDDSVNFGYIKYIVPN